ncbi:hypothetical protein [Grimontia hollisae]|nr:hypothetical protein [Grimontia hollisae]
MNTQPSETDITPDSINLDSLFKQWEFELYGFLSRYHNEEGNQ